MARALMWFVILLALLGVGTVWLIEKGTGEDLDLMPGRRAEMSELQSFVLDQRIRLHYWWSRMAHAVESTHHTPALSEKPAASANSGQPQIIKWRDAQGTWHFEDRKPDKNPPKDHQ